MLLISYLQILFTTTHFFNFYNNIYKTHKTKKKIGTVKISNDIILFLIVFVKNNFKKVINSIINGKSTSNTTNVLLT